MSTMEAYHHKVDEGFAWIILIICVVAQCFEHVATAGIYYMAIIHQFYEGMFLLTHEFTLIIFLVNQFLIFKTRSQKSMHISVTARLLESRKFLRILQILADSRKFPAHEYYNVYSRT